MYADADAVRAALDEEDGPVVLVGHSYGGMVITDAAAGHGNVKHLVYVTSVMAELEETLASFGGSREPRPWMDPHRRMARWASRPSSHPTPLCNGGPRPLTEGRRTCL
jgi:pimeloyl-ACP methyl ester carboxylesterase